ncbi:MAG TPA: hypothetical protein VF334_14925, partial [Polyangia bacterium]
MIGAGATLLAAASCGPKVTKRACMGSGTDNPLVADAAMVRLDVYGADAHCADGSTLASGAGAPILSRSYSQGQAISLDVPPGPHALVLSTFADANGTQLLGLGCTEANLAAGSQICFDLTIVPGPDGGDVDLAAPSACTVTPNSCPKGSYCDGTQCEPGCATDNDCTSVSDDGGTGIFRCNPTTHACGPCCEPIHGTCAANCTITCDTGYGDCNGTPADGCETNTNTSLTNCGACDRACSNTNVATMTCAGGLCTSTCQSGSGNCVRPAAPTADDGCETNTNTNVDNCGACNRACSGTHVATRSCNAGLCNSTCSSAAFGNCAQPAAPTADDGCETDVTSNVLHCGSCTTTCTVPANSTATCTSSTCGSTCNSGFDNCDNSSGNGCECATDPAAPACCATTMCQTVHNNGFGGHYYDCNALGQPGVTPTTYSSVMAN